MESSVAPGGDGPCAPEAGRVVQPWEQQPGEPNAYFRVFQDYLELGRERAVVAVAAMHAGDAGAIGASSWARVCTLWKWCKRAAAWDAAQAAAQQAAAQQAAAQQAEPEASERPVWEQQPGEPGHHYAVFRHYLALGCERSIHAAAAQAAAQAGANGRGLSAQYCGQIAAQWKWRERAAAWDAAQAGVQAAGAPEPLPWEQQPRESDRWYRVFRRYLELGPARNVNRAVVSCIDEDPTAPSPIHAYHEAHLRRWQQRAEAWDLHCLENPGEEAGADAGQAEVAEAREPVHPWDRQEGEPMRAYGFFCRYLELGPTRSISRAVRDLGNGQGKRVNDTFYVLARRWKWQQRAAEWDAHQRDLLAARVQERRCALYEHRLDVAEIYFDQAVDAMDTANITNLTEAEARRMLPTIHTILKDMGAIQRTEIELAEKQRQRRSEQQLQLSWEVMDRAWRQVEQRQAAAQQAAAQQAGGQQAGGQQAGAQQAGGLERRMLLVCVGPHPELALDLAVLRAASNLELHRLTDLTRGNLEAMLRRERLHGRPIELVHMAVHAGREGVEFADGVVDGQWLSERLAGVQVLMLSGCKTDQVGDWLRVVPYVVTLADDISNGDAALLAEQFWRGIGAGMEPTGALAEALGKAAPMVREFVTRHW